jgi:hypothetical protein
MPNKVVFRREALAIEYLYEQAESDIARVILGHIPHRQKEPSKVNYDQGQGAFEPNPRQLLAVNRAISEHFGLVQGIG